MDFKVYPDLTKTYILSRISQEKLMEYYMKIPVIPKNFQARSFRNPFRKDDHPSCNYFYGTKDHKLRYRDFGGTYEDRLYNADVFDIVARLNNLDINHKHGFMLVLHIIARDFKLHKYEQDGEVILFNEFLAKQIKSETKTKVIKIVPRKWNKGDELYWYNKYGIPGKLLSQGKVLAVDEVWMEGRTGDLFRYYKYRVGDLAYAYYGGKQYGIDIWKVYFPDRKNVAYPKIIQNKPFVQGYHMFEPCKIGVVTKSYKDVFIFKSFGISAVAVASETICLTDNEVFWLKRNADHLVSLMDYDRAGIQMARMLRTRYNIRPFMLTRGRFGMPDYGVKDISDFRERYGYQKTFDLLESAIDSLWEELEYSNRLNTNQLVW